VERNELFAPGRMAYVIELDDELAESDIPTTLIRSRADCPGLEVCVKIIINNRQYIHIHFYFSGTIRHY
jgi:IK cytokine